MHKKELFIFDMDGVLIESEPFWRQAQIEALSQHGVVISNEDCIQHTMGHRLDDIANIWINMFDLNVSTSHLMQSILDGVIERIQESGVAKLGIYTLIDYLQCKECRIALATSSSTPIICAVLEKLGLSEVFELTLSADDVTNGKPAPDVYLGVCEKMGVPTDNAIALEDSLTGVRAGVAAKITTIAIPEIVSEKFEIADHVAKSMDDVLHFCTSYFES